VVGDETVVEFGFQDNGRNFEPLKFSVVLRIVGEEKLSSNSGAGAKAESKKGKGPSLGMPDFRWVPETLWAEHSFNEESGAYVQTGDKSIVYINQDNKFLRALRAREKDEGTRVLNENIFKLGLGILTLSVHKNVTDAHGGLDSEALTRTTSSAIARHIVTVVRRLGNAAGQEASR
jgi:hypothetical protein